MSRAAAGSRRSTKTEYIETDTGNKISRRTHIEGKQNIMLGGKSVLMAGVHLRGDLARNQERPASAEANNQANSAANAKAQAPVTAINIGRATVISTNCTIHPPMRVHHGQMTFYPLRIGDNVFIGAGTHVSAASISSHTHIGANCVLSPFCVIREGCKILPNTVVPPTMVIPAGSIVAGRPARIIGEVGDGWGQSSGAGEGEEWVEGGDLRPLVRTIK